MIKKFFKILTITVFTAGIIILSGCKKDDKEKGTEQPSEPEIEEGVVINGVRWATRNLDVGGVFVKRPEDFGALFQWGRRADGHESRTSENYPTNDDTPEDGAVFELDANGQIPVSHSAYGKFIKQSAEPFDWRTPKDDELWNSGTETQPIKTVNDPCPCGWRLPTGLEFKSLVAAGSVWRTQKGIYGQLFGSGDDTIFLPAAGYRYNSDGTVNWVRMGGYYWSSVYFKLGPTLSYVMIFYDTDIIANVLTYRANGLSVRCVADE